MSISCVFTAARRLLAVALLGASVTACDDPFSPYWDHGRYDLRSANNRPVPAIVSEGPGGSFTEVIDGSLTLRRDHSYQLLLDVREVTGGRVYEFTKAFAGEYESEDRTIYLTYFDAVSSHRRLIVANWRGGRIELVVPRVDGYEGVLCLFSD